MVQLRIILCIIWVMQHVQTVVGVMMFTVYPNMCIANYHQHLTLEKCQLDEKQDFKIDDGKLQVGSGNEQEYLCVVYNHLDLPVRVEHCNIKSIKQQFVFLSVSSGGCLIKLRDFNSCLAIISPQHPLHLKNCDAEDLAQRFSFSGATCLKHLQTVTQFPQAQIELKQITKIKRPRFGRMFTS